MSNGDGAAQFDVISALGRRSGTILLCVVLTIAPIILGGGKTIFVADGKALPFTLVSTAKANTGAQVCRYVRAR